jgi:AraC family transcriptional regulator
MPISFLLQTARACALEIAGGWPGFARDPDWAGAILTSPPLLETFAAPLRAILSIETRSEPAMSLVTSKNASRDFQPHAEAWRSFAWPGGCFDTAVRPPTAYVEGRITLSHPTIMAVIEGGCGSIEVISDCGHRYNGADFAGAASFIPAEVTRHIKMRNVRSKWASLSIRPDLFTLSDERGMPQELAPFTNRNEPFLAAMLAELRRLRCESERLNGLYCEAMAVSAAQYLFCRYGRQAEPGSLHASLPGWRLRRVKEYIADHLGDQDLRLDDIAASIDLSTGFFHRAFRRTTGETPLGYIQRRRIEEAMRLLALKDLSIAEVAIKVGFWSPSHFARLFRRRTGMTPSQYRSGKK